MRKFEYMTKFSLTNDELNALGLKGWELVLIDSNSDTAYFKREKVF